MPLDIIECEEFSQCGNGGAAVKNGNHASQRGSKGKGGKNGKGSTASAAKPAGGAAASMDQEPLGKTLEAPDALSGDRLRPIYQYADEIEVGKGVKPDPKLVEAFKRGDTNISPVLAYEQSVLTPVGRETRVIAVGTESARIIASAAAAGASSRVNTLMLDPDNKKGMALAVKLQQEKKAAFGKRRDFEFISAYPDEVKGGKTTFSQKKIDRLAKEMRRMNQPNAVIPVREVGNGRFELIGNNGNALAVARRAGVRIPVQVYNTPALTAVSSLEAKRGRR